MVRALTPILLMVALLLLLITVIPEPRGDCLIPPHAPTRGFYEKCWGFWELWA